MVQRWRRDQVTILSGELKMTAKVQKWAVSPPRTPNYRRASDGVVFTAERPKYFMSNAK